MPSQKEFLKYQLDVRANKMKIEQSDQKSNIIVRESNEIKGKVKAEKLMEDPENAEEIIDANIVDEEKDEEGVDQTGD